MRYVIARKGERKIKKNVTKLIRTEKKQCLNKISSCLKFKKNCLKSKSKFQKQIFSLKKSGKKIYGYAASAKSSTVLNFCGIDNKYIDYVVDSTKEKIGKYTPGTHIPIVSETFFRKNYPDIVILNSWNHKKEIISKEKKYVKMGGKFISHVK